MDSENIIIHPRKGRSERAIPETGIVLVTPSEADYGHSLLLKNSGSKSFLYHSRLTVDYNQELFVAGPAVGAPMAAMTMEKLIALGAGKIIMYGWCGGASPAVRVGDVVVGGKGVIGEGTSRYYHGKGSSHPSEAVCEGISRLFEDAGLAVKKGNVWSTDAPYREDRLQIAQLRDDDNVVAVDMEYSALCSVSAFRGIEFGAAFLVSDELYHTSWKPGYKGKPFKEKSRQIVRLLCGVI